MAIILRKLDKKLNSSAYRVHDRRTKNGTSETQQQQRQKQRHAWKYCSHAIECGYVASDVIADDSET